VLFFVVTLSPVLGLIPFTYFQYSFVADHFQYLASLGIITLIAPVRTSSRRLADPSPVLWWMALCVAVLAAASRD